MRAHSNADTEIEELIRRLEGHPLAVCQAGVYIKESGMSVSDYLTYFSSHLSDLLSEDSDLSYQNGSIRTSLNISMEALERRDPIAAKLLQLWGFLDNMDLWHDLFSSARSDSKTLSSLPYLIDGDIQAQIEWQTAASKTDFVVPEDPKSWLDEIATDQKKFLKAMRSLHEFSLMRKVNDTDGYSVHPIVHETARKSLPQGMVAGYLGAVVQILGRAAPYAHHRDASVLQRRLTPHVDRFWKIFDEEGGQVASTLAAAEGFHGLSCFEFDRSNFSRASTTYARACQGRQKFLGMHSRLTIRCFHDEGLVFRELGHYDEAKERWIWMHRHSTEILGPFSHTALRSLDDLGRLATLQGDHVMAARYLEQALEGKKQAFSDDPLYIYDTARQLALAYVELNRLEEAQKMQLAVLEVFGQHLDQDHPWTLLAMSDLATLYGRQGRLQEGEILLRGAFDLMMTALGPKNKKTEEVGAKLMNLLERQGKQVEMKALRQQLGNRSAGPKSGDVQA